MNTLPKPSVIFMPQIAMGGGIRIETAQEICQIFYSIFYPWSDSDFRRRELCASFPTNPESPCRRTKSDFSRMSALRTTCRTTSRGAGNCWVLPDGQFPARRLCKSESLRIWFLFPGTKKCKIKFYPGISKTFLKLRRSSNHLLSQKVRCQVFTKIW